MKNPPSCEVDSCLHYQEITRFLTEFEDTISLIRHCAHENHSLDPIR